MHLQKSTASRYSAGPSNNAGGALMDQANIEADMLARWNSRQKPSPNHQCCYRWSGEILGARDAVTAARDDKYQRSHFDDYDDQPTLRFNARVAFVLRGRSGRLGCSGLGTSRYNKLGKSAKASCISQETISRSLKHPRATSNASLHSSATTPVLSTSRILRFS